ncbi:unnamed protein product [Arctogadus glacialis]
MCRQRWDTFVPPPPLVCERTRGPSTRWCCDWPAEGWFLSAASSRGGSAVGRPAWSHSSQCPSSQCPAQPVDGSEVIEQETGHEITPSAHTLFTAAASCQPLITSHEQHNKIRYVGSVEGLAYHRGWDMLYWTSYTTSTITRHTVDQARWGAANRHTVVAMSGDDHPRAFVLDECQRWLDVLEPPGPLINVLILSFMI